ncbi:MAG TPA: alkaline phosphatase D family protein [Terriglobia bacterium]|nr:alkaline phosphatase D family protein [Terriglobia bacterium]
MNRRDFILAFGALPAMRGERQVRLSSNPFTLGVASGDPAPGGVVLWTRLAGVEPQRVAVHWEIAADDRFRRIARKGSSLALKEFGYSVHAEVGGLQPGRDYWYRFMTGGVASPVGKTRTARTGAGAGNPFRFAFVSCQNYEHGYFTAYRHLAAEDLDVVVHLGDYIYETRFGTTIVRQHEAGEVFTLDQYRARYSLYRSEPELQAAHAAFPWIVTPDDHEVQDNYAGAISKNDVPPAEFLRRRAAGYQAYYEFMPLRRTSMPAGPDISLFRKLSFGSLIDFHVLDTRQYRSDQPCGDGLKPRCAAALAPSQTMMGAKQENWLMNGLRSSQARWNVLANQVMIADVAQPVAGARTFSMDKWGGYVEARKRLLDFLGQARPSNPIVITGDIHSNWVSDLKLDFDNPSSTTVGTEFVGTSITSGGDGNDSVPEGLFAVNPHIKFFNTRRGYVRATVTPSLWTSDYRVVPYVSRPAAPVETRASFVVESGRPGAQRA